MPTATGRRTESVTRPHGRPGRGEIDVLRRAGRRVYDPAFWMRTRAPSFRLPCRRHDRLVPGEAAATQHGRHSVPQRHRAAPRAVAVSDEQEGGRVLADDRALGHEQRVTPRMVTMRTVERPWLAAGVMPGPRPSPSRWRGVVSTIGDLVPRPGRRWPPAASSTSSAVLPSLRPGHVCFRQEDSRHQRREVAMVTVFFARLMWRPCHNGPSTTRRRTARGSSCS